MGATFLQRLLKRYDAGTASRAERYLVDRWYDSLDNPGHPVPGIETAEQIIETRNRLFSRIQVRQYGVVKRWYQQAGIRVAASLVLVSLLVFLLYPTGRTATATVFHAGKGQIKKVILTDSTEVWLSGNTQLEVAADYAGDDRKVTLTGEAWFQVTRNPRKPFIITSGDLQTRVLGTSFNVSAHPALTYIAVTVNTGKVSVHKGDRLMATLLPGNAIQYNKATGLATVNNKDPEVAMGWRNGRVMLEDASWNELATQFGNMFNITLRSPDNAVRQLRFRLLLNKQLSVHENLAIITGIHQLKWREINKHEIEIYHP